jgi:phage portal protein BeeE
MFRWPWQKNIKASQGATRNIVINSLENEFLTCSLTNEIITPQKAFTIYQQNSSAATAVDMIADEFEKLLPVIELADGSIIDKHPVLDLLRNPNPYMDWNGLAARISRNYLLTRQNPMYAMGVNTLPPQELFPVRPTFITTETNRNEYVNVYHIGAGVAEGVYKQELTSDRIARYYDQTGLKELYCISGYSSSSTDARPDSPLQAAALEAQQQLKGKLHNVQLLNNGGRMSLLIIFKDTGVDDDEMKRRLQRLNEKFAGAENAGKIGAFEGGEVQEVREMGTTQKDMDWSNLNETASRALYQRYKIPLPMITTDASSFNNLSTAVEMLYDFAVLPHADKQFSGLSRFLLPRYKIGLNEARITYNPDSIKALKERRLEELLKRKEIGIETIKEMREAIPNRPFLPGTEVLYHNATQVPVGQDINDDGGVNDGS